MRTRPVTNGTRALRRLLGLAAISAFVAAAGCDRADSPANPAPQGAAAPASQGAPTLVTSVEGIEEYRLDNGLRVLLFRDASNATVTVNMTYLVGSVQESYGETGMAHLLEHMLFKGTKNRENIFGELEDHGANFNGSTAWDRTNYFETVDATPENLEWALELEADRMVNSLVAKDELDTEMTVVRNEFENRENSPTGVLFERVMNAAYIWHGYGRSPIGSRSDIENVPIERLQAFYRKFYQPDNAVLIVAGRFDQANALDLIQKHFGAIPKPERELEQNYTVEPVQDGEREVIVRRVGDVQLLMAAYHTPNGAHPDFVPLQMAAAVLTDAPSGRLYKALVETGLAARVGVDTLQNKDPGLAIFVVTVPKDKSLDAVRAAFDKTLADLAQNPITQEELDRAKNDALSYFERSMNDSQGIALQLSEWAAMGDWRLMFLDRDRVRSVTAEDAQRTALQYIKTSNRTLGMFIPGEPDRAEIPPSPNLTSLLEGYKGDEVRSEGEEFDPSPANIEMRTTRTELPGGTKLLMLPKETRGDSVVASIVLRIGDEESLRNTDGASSLTAQMLMRGTRNRTRQQIQDELARLQSQLNVGGGSGTVTANIQSTRENLPAVIDLAIEVLREPAFPQNELDTLRASSLASIEQQRSQPQSIISRAFSKHWSQYPRGDIRYVTTVDEDIERLSSMTVQRLRDFHTDFYGASNAEVAIVGDFDTDAIRAQIAEKLDSWRSPKPYREVLSTYPNPPIAPTTAKFETPDKENAFFVAGMPIQMMDSHPDYPALVLGEFLLGGSASSRFFERVRIQDGLSYSAGTNFSAPALSDRASFTAQAISAPQNAEKVQAAFREELQKALSEGYAADELAMGKQSWATSRQVGRSDDGQLLGRLLGLMHIGRTMTWDADLEAKVQALTMEQVRDAMQRHFAADKMAFMLAGDFARAAQAAAPAAAAGN